METTNWLRQTADKPLYPDVLWSRPENRRHAGRLLIIGGHQQSFNAVSDSYATAIIAGAGTVRVVLPDKLQKMLSALFPEAEFAASTKIGSFSRQPLNELLESAKWAEAVLLAGDFGKNSETATLLESFAQKFTGKLALAGDSVDYFLTQASTITDRDNTLVVASLDKIQKLATPTLIQQNVDLIKAVGQLSNWSGEINSAILTVHSNQAIVAYQQQISITPVKQKIDMASLAAYATVWWLQQPEKPFEAITTAAHCYSQE